MGGWEGGCRQRDLSASLPRTALASTGAAERSGPAPPEGSKPALARARQPDERASESASDGSGCAVRVARQDNR